MMEMDDRDSAKCQNSERGDMMGISKIVNEEKDKNVNSLLLHFETQTGSGWTKTRVSWDFSFLEREGAPSL